MIAKIPSRSARNKWRNVPIEEQPRAVILDPTCRAPLNKMLNRASKNQVPSPWILCRDDIQPSGGCYVPLKANDDGKFKWDDILTTLSAKGLNLVVIEGGGVVINDVLAQRIADVIIISISPVFLGGDGVGVHPVLDGFEWLEDVQTIALGNDVIVAGRVRRDGAALKT